MTLPSLGLDPQDVASLLDLLNRHAPKAEVWAFGSRVSGKPRRFSDLDIVLVQEKRLDAQTRAELNDAISESDLPVKVDVVEWASTSPSFREIILQNHVVLKPK